MSSRPRNVGTGGKKLDFSVLKRLMGYIFEKYKTLYIIVFIMISHIQTLPEFLPTVPLTIMKQLQLQYMKQQMLGRVRIYQIYRPWA